MQVGVPRGVGSGYGHFEVVGGGCELSGYWFDLGGANGDVRAISSALDSSRFDREDPCRAI